MHCLDDILDLILILNCSDITLQLNLLLQAERVFLRIRDISTDLNMRIIRAFFLNLIATLFSVNFSFGFHLYLLSDELLHACFIDGWRDWE